MAVKNVQGLLLQELRDLYDAEKQLVRALPKMAKGASSEQLRQAFEEHLDEGWSRSSRRWTSVLAASLAKRCEGSPRKPAR